MITTLFLGMVLSAPATAATVQAKVDGLGYFRFAREGRAVYLKKCAFTIKGGKLVNSMGDYTLPQIPLSDASEKLEIDLEGNVLATVGGSTNKVGRLVLAIFSDTAALSEKDGVLIAADRPKLGNPGEDVNGVIRMTEEDTKPVQTPPAQNPPTKPVEKPTEKPVENPPVTKPAETKPAETKPAETKPNPPAITGKGVTIKIGAAATVVEDIIKLYDLAEIDTLDSALHRSLSAIELGKSPSVNGKTKLRRTDILAAIREAGYRTENFVIVVPDTVEVTREVKVVLASEFVAMAEQAIQQTGTQYQYELAEPAKDVKVPSGKITLVPGIVNGINTQNANVKVIIYQVTGEGAAMKIKEINSQTIRFKVKSAPVTIRSGTSVKVVMKAGSAEVEMLGMARSTASLGQAINVEVRASDQKTMHQGKVIGLGLVEVMI